MASAGSVEFQLEANLAKLKQDLENAKKNIASFSKEAEKNLTLSPRIRINANAVRTKELGRSISDGIVKGMDTKKVESSGKQVAESLVASVKRALKINSPSKVFYDIGTDIVDGLSGGVKGKIKSFSDSVKGEVGNLVSDIQKQSPTAKLSFTGLSVGVAGVAMFKDQIIGLGKSAIDTAMAFEGLSNTINIVTGSSTAGASKFGEMKSLASELGIDLRTLSSGYAKLSASTANTQLQGADTDGMIRAISQAGVAYGLTNEQLNGTIVAMSQMAGKGVVSMEELRQQLAERIPGAMGIAARAMKMTERELFDLVSTGTLSINDFWPKFYKQLAIETPLATNTSRQSFARLGNEITEISMKAGQALLPIAKGIAEITTEVLKFASTHFDTILKGIAVSFGAIAMASVPVIASLTTGLTAIAGKLGLANAGAILASIGFKGLLAILGPLAVKAGVLYAVLETGGAVFNLLKDQLGGSKQAYSDWADQVDASVEKVNKSLLNLTTKEVEIKPPRLDKNKVVDNNNWFADLFSMSPENIEKSVVNANKIREKFGKAPMSESEINSFRERARSPLGFTGLTRSKGQNEADQAKINMSEAGLKSNKFSDLLGAATQQYKSGSGPLAEVAKIEKAMKSLQSQKSIIPASDVARAKALDSELQKLNAERNKLMSPLEGAEAGLRGWLKLNQDKYAEYLQALQDQYSDDKAKREQASKFLTSAGNDDASMEQVRINAELASKALAQYEQAQKASGAVNETQKLAIALAELGSAFENIKSRIDQMNIGKLTELGQIELSGFDTDIFNSFNAGVAKAQQGVASLKQEIQDRENITKKLTEDLSISPARQSAIQLISDEELKRGKTLVASEIEALAKVWGEQDANLKSALESEAKLRGEAVATSQMKLELLGQELALKQAIEQKTLAGLAEERAARQALNKIKSNEGNVSLANTYKEGMQTNINAESDFNVASAEQALIALQANTNEVAQAIDRLNQKRLDGSLSAEKYNEQIRQLSLEQSDLSVQTANAEITQIKAVQQARAEDLARRKQELETKINIQNTTAQSDIISKKLSGKINDSEGATELARLSKENNQALLVALDANKAQMDSAFADGAMNLGDYNEKILALELDRVRLVKSTLDDELNIRKAVADEIAKTRSDLEKKLEISTSTKQVNVSQSQLTGTISQEQGAIEQAKIEKQNTNDLLNIIAKNSADIEKAYANGQMNLGDYNDKILDLESERLRAIKAGLEDELNIRKAVADEIAKQRQDLEKKLDISTSRKEITVVSHQVDGTLDENQVATQSAKLAKENNQELLAIIAKNSADIEKAYANGQMNLGDYNDKILDLEAERLRAIKAGLDNELNIRRAISEQIAKQRQDLEKKLEISTSTKQVNVSQSQLTGNVTQEEVAVEQAKLAKENNQELLAIIDKNRADIEQSYANGAMNLREYNDKILALESERLRAIKAGLEDEINIRKAMDNEILANMDKRVKEQSHLSNMEMLQLKEKSKLSELKSDTPKSDLATQLEQNKTALLDAGQAIDQMKLKLSEMQKLSPSPENTQKILDLERELNEAVLGKRLTLLDHQLAIKNKIKDVTEMEVLGIENQLKISSELATLDSARTAQAKARSGMELKALEGRAKLAEIDLGDSGNYEISVKLLDRQYAIQQAINKAKSDQAKADLVASQKALDMDYQREQLTLRKAEIENRQAVLRAKNDVLVAQQSGNQLAIQQAKQQLQVSSDALGVILQQQSINNQNYGIKKNTLGIETKALIAEEKIAKIKEKQVQIQNRINLAQSAVTKELDKQKTRLDAIAALSQTVAKAKLNGLDKQAGFLDQALTLNTDLKGEDLPDTLRKELQGQLDQLTGGGANNNEKKLLMDRLALEEKIAKEKLKALEQEHAMQKALLQIELTKQNMAAQMAVIQAHLLAQQLAQNGMAKEGRQLIQDALAAQQSMKDLGQMAMQGLTINQDMEKYNQQVDNFTGINAERRKVAEAGYTPIGARPIMPQYEPPKYKPINYDPNQMAKDAVINTTGMVGRLVEAISRQLEARIGGVPGPTGNTAPAPVSTSTTNNQTESVVNNVTNNTTLTVISSDPTGDARKVLADLTKANKNRF